ncbi:AAA family ATPase [Actinocrispum wychmicini]|uniref:SpoVK/Ycf46/Vps4 family AAA+-type ATPase n=1 Tax=Actinocrispum wychmicini TaxID=1213861 RepID=A0A4V2S878_9PSEU|nr:AAA family ATPase [Actinocrispum wychmicini]TCO62600.1 SpoVK/Ycf46/Vps4 family AAA+-type ATPase [Actinocrispum wychmicini]
MGRPELPEHLALLLTNEPVFDLYAHGPWRVPDGLYEEITRRGLALNADPRLSDLPFTLSDYYAADTTIVGAELWCLAEYLCGASAVRGGSRSDLEYELFPMFLAEPELPDRDPVWACMRSSTYRPPGDWLISAAGNNPDKRAIAYQLARECLDVFDGIEPLEHRRQALIALHELAKPEETTETPRSYLADIWARSATDDILAALPELSGPVNHLEWALDGFVAAHDRLRAVVDGGSAASLIAGLVQAAGATFAPAEFAVLGNEELFGEVSRTLARPFSSTDWWNQVRSWLALCVAGGEIDACRAWLDMYVRLDSALRGLPGVASNPNLDIPVVGFQRTVRQMFVRRPLTNPLVGRMTVAPVNDQPEPPADAPMVGQPELVAAAKEIVGAKERPVRLLIAGPDATGRRTGASLLLGDLMNDHLVAGARWVSDELYSTLDASSAVQQITRDIETCAHDKMLMVVDGLDRLLSFDRCGPIVAEELRRALKRYPGLNVVAVCGTGGDSRLFDVNPALYQQFLIARTQEFTDKQYAELVRRAVIRRGATISRTVTLTAGVMLTRTPPMLNLRGARLVEYLAEQCVAAARKRAKVGRTRSVSVTAADLPGQLVPGGVAAADPQAELDSCVGLDKIKRELALLVAEEKAQRMRREAGAVGVGSPAGGRNNTVVSSQPRHLVFTGQPGTGKTMIARILGRMYAGLGVLTSGHIVVVDRADLVQGETWEIGPRVRRAIDRAAGGVLCVEDAHELQPSEDSWREREVVNALQAAIQSRTSDLVVVLTGTDAGVNGLLKSESELAAFFPSVLRFPALTEDGFVELFATKAAAGGFTLQDGVLEQVRGLLSSTPTGNARLAVSLLERAVSRLSRRVLADDVLSEDESLHEILVEDVPETLATTSWVELPNDPLTEIDSLIGLTSVKDEVRLLVAEAKADRMRREAGIPLATPTRHLVFTGSPGTAKTTMARLVAAAYAKLGLLTSGHLVEVSRGDLIGEYLGQTTPKVRAAVAQALGGVLFIDEAYSLTPAWYDGYGMEAIAELIKLMEEHRDDLVVIVAGYERKMAQFMAANPGLASRFPTTLQFPDYTDTELVDIFTLMAHKAGYTLANDLLPAIHDLLRGVIRDETFGNGRYIRNIFDRAVALQGQRITESPNPPTDVRLLLAKDLPPTHTNQPDNHSGQYL